MDETGLISIAFTHCQRCSRNTWDWHHDCHFFL